MIWKKLRNKVKFLKVLRHFCEDSKEFYFWFRCWACKKVSIIFSNNLGWEDMGVIYVLALYIVQNTYYYYYILYITFIS